MVTFLAAFIYWLGLAFLAVLVPLALVAVYVHIRETLDPEYQFCLWRPTWDEETLDEISSLPTVEPEHRRFA